MMVRHWMQQDGEDMAALYRAIARTVTCQCQGGTALPCYERDTCPVAAIKLDGPGRGGGHDMTYDELVSALRHPSNKMIDAMAGAMSPGKRPTTEFVSVREKHRIRFRAAINVLLGEEH